MYKLLMSWDVRQGKEKEYGEFLTHEFAPALMRMGIRPTDVWHALYGDSPQVRAGGASEDLEALEEILRSDEWRDLEEKLLTYVTNLHRKVVVAAGGFQI
jgi:hypothetical protein